jgi:hypothetical protein
MTDLCALCGEPIDRERRPRSAYCSTQHQLKARDARRVWRYVPRSVVVRLTCESCSQPFEHTRIRGQLPKRCPECRQAEQERRAAWRTGPHPHNRRLRPCEVCGALYKPTYYGQRTCSRAHGIVLRRRIYGTAAGGRRPGQAGAKVPNARGESLCARAGKSSILRVDMPLTCPFAPLPGGLS